MAQNIHTSLQQLFSASGSPYSGAKMYIYQTGTTTELSLYSDEALSTAIANPIVADSAGVFAQAFVDDAYTRFKVVVTDSSDNTIYTRDPVYSISRTDSFAAASVTFDGTNISFSSTNVQDAIEEMEEYFRENPTFSDSTDDTKRITFDISGITTSTNRTIAWPDEAGTVVLHTATQTLTNKTLTTPTLTLKQSASPTPTAEGDVQWDTDDNVVAVGDGSGTQLFAPLPASTAAGDTLYLSGAKAYSRIAIGSANQVWKVNSGGTAPEWGAASSILVDEVEPTSDVSEMAVTGLSAYRDVRMVFAAEITSVGTIDVQARPSGGSWTTVLSITGVSTGDGFVGWVDIVNFGRNNDMKLFRAEWHDVGNRLDRSDQVQSAVSTSVSGYASFSVAEQWDEVRILPSSGNLEGSNADERSYLIVYGIGDGD